MAEATSEHPIPELLAVILLSVTAVLTAWSGFEASKWSGDMSVAFSKASSARVEASRQAERADAARGFDLNVFGIYIQAVGENNDRVRDFVETRFTQHFKLAFDAWMASKPLKNPKAAASPFALREYRAPGEAESKAADSRADAFFARALRSNQRGDNYTLLTVLFALVLFLAAISQRVHSTRLVTIVLGAGTIVMLAGMVLLLTFPKMI